jgi:hypothetical protein
MKHTLWVVLMTGLISSMAVAFVAVPAEAVTPRPATAPLVDAGGTGSGCDTSVGVERPASGPADGPYAGSPGWMNLQVDLSCTHHWRAVSIRDRWQTVTAEGRRGTLFPGGSSKSWAPDSFEPSPEPYSASSWAEISPCMMRSDGSFHLPGTTDLAWLLPLGSNQFLLGAFTKVNEFKSDLHPYRAVVEQLVTVRCTRARAAYR